MNRDQVDAFLAEADDVIEDWEGSTDSASWSGDGSHEVDEIAGGYYLDDQPHPSCCLACELTGGTSMRVELLAPLTEEAAAQLGFVEGLLGYELEPWQRNGFLRALAYATPVVMSSAAVSILRTRVAGVEPRGGAR